MKIQQYENKKLMEKISIKMEKAERIKKEREDLLVQRDLMKKEIEKEKREMFEKIEKVKLGKIDPNELLKSLSSDNGSSLQVNRVE